MRDFYRKNIRIGLDIDEVCGNFLAHYSSQVKKDWTTAKHFYFSYDSKNLMKDLDEEFWLTMPPKVDGSNLTFLPRCYISKRLGLPVEWTEQWLEKNGFPCMPVIHVEGSKVQACKDMNLDFYIDDSMCNYQELNANGINTFLMDCTHNRQYNVGSDRVMNLNDLPKHIINYEAH